ncbi:MAG: hypothetical protein ACKOAX_13630, partial [Candidatus Kapaibacterium sp.]
MTTLRLPLACLLVMLVCVRSEAQSVRVADSLLDGWEKHVRNLRQLTRNGENAEAYLSFDERRLVYQAHIGDTACDQIYTMRVDGSQNRLVSTGKGRTTCAYYLPNGNIIYASTHAASAQCPAKPDMSKGYVWPLYADYDIYECRPDGSRVRPLVSGPGYDAEATVSPRGDRIVFTSTRDGDIELYSCDLKGGDVKRLTDHFGYDGGAFFSLDGSKIVFRASSPKGKDSVEFSQLLAQNLVRPRALDIYVMNADGSGRKRLTDNGKANFAPFFHPDGKRIIFSSNMGDPKGRNFDLWMINIDGTGLEQVTFFEQFDGFPMFTRDGKK